MTEILTPTRRGLILGLAGLFCAPAIVRATSIMPVRALVTAPEALDFRIDGDWTVIGDRWEVYNPERSLAFAREAEAMRAKFPSMFDATYVGFRSGGQTTHATRRQIQSFVNGRDFYK